MKKKLNIAVIGKGFMGMVHSHMWLTVSKMFDVDYEPVLKVLCGTDEASTKAFAQKWGFESYTTDWKQAISRDDIDVVDIVTPPYLHKDMVLYACEHKKQIFLEKPVSMNLAEAETMLKAAKDAGVLHYLNHNYRRAPAVTFAKQLIDEGKIGKMYHYRGTYIQDWAASEDYPLMWNMQKEKAGAGCMIDIAAHNMDIARYLVGEIDSLYAQTRTFIKQRKLPVKGAQIFNTGDKAKSEMGEVTVDDACFITMDFVDRETLGSCDTSRFGKGRRNYHSFEIYGEKGSLRWDLERMDELEFCDNTCKDGTQGFKRILVTDHIHPYMKNWWAPGHIIGYEATFTNAAYDFITALTNGTEIRPNLYDGVEISKLVEAIKVSEKENRKVKV
jgi:predicted dehydrogenase